MKRIAVLGCTGSIGRQTIEVIRDRFDKYEVVALGCRNNLDAMIRQAQTLGTSTLLYASGEAIDGYRCYVGEDAMWRYAQEGDYDVLVVAVVGIAGLRPTLAALARSKIVLLANKETLVCGGNLVMTSQLMHEGVLLPIDSEHSALWQCLDNQVNRRTVKKLILTASGGALRDMPLEALSSASVADVLRHPNWRMGDKITVDCATMVNKGFEVIEAMHLFGVSLDRIQVLLHRQSLVHSMVQFADNSYLAQMAVADMRLPIQYALDYPERRSAIVDELDLTACPLTFAKVDDARYPSLGVVVDAAKRGSNASTAVNAADEVAVEAFLAGHIAYGNIHTILTHTASRFEGNARDLIDIELVDRDARRIAKEGICSL